MSTKDAEDAPPLWERQVGEPTKAAEAFRMYRDLGARRSNQKVAETLGCTTAITGGWSRQWNWVRRSQAWDDEQDRVGRAATLQEVADMHKRHAQIGMVMLNKVAARLMGSPEIDVVALDPNKLNARDLAYLADIAVKLERSARGEITAKVAVQHSGNIDHVVSASLEGEDARAAEAIAALVEAGVFPQEALEALGVGADTEPPNDDEDVEDDGDE